MMRICQGDNVGKQALLAALGHGRLARMLDIAARHPFVVFGTMEGEAIARLVARDADGAAPALPVYFYETG